MLFSTEARPNRRTDVDVGVGRRAAGLQTLSVSREVEHVHPSRLQFEQGGA